MHDGSHHNYHNLIPFWFGEHAQIQIQIQVCIVNYKNLNEKINAEKRLLSQIQVKFIILNAFLFGVCFKLFLLPTRCVKDRQEAFYHRQEMNIYKLITFTRNSLWFRSFSITITLFCILLYRSNVVICSPVLTIFIIHGTIDNSSEWK